MVAFPYFHKTSNYTCLMIRFTTWGGNRLFEAHGRPLITEGSLIRDGTLISFSTYSVHVI